MQAEIKVLVNQEEIDQHTKLGMSGAPPDAKYKATTLAFKLSEVSRFFIDPTSEDNDMIITFYPQTSYIGVYNPKVAKEITDYLNRF